MSVIEIISVIIGVLGGSGGVFAFITARQQTKIQDRASSAEEWQKLYTEMKERLDEQEKANNSLRDEIKELKTQLRTLTAELETYKKYDTYITTLEIYVTSLLNTIKTLVKEDIYKQLVEKRPHRQMDLSSGSSTGK